MGRGTRRMHVVRLADVVASVRRTSKKRRDGRIDIREKSCFPKGEEKQGPESTVIVTQTQQRLTLVKMR